MKGKFIPENPGENVSYPGKKNTPTRTDPKSDSPTRTDPK